MAFLLTNARCETSSESLDTSESPSSSLPLLDDRSVFVLAVVGASAAVFPLPLLGDSDLVSSFRLFGG